MWPTRLISAVLILLVGTSLAQAVPPAQLLGKSVVMTWTDTRSQRDGDNPEFHTTGARARRFSTANP